MDYTKLFSECIYFYFFLQIIPSLNPPAFY